MDLRKGARPRLQWRRPGHSWGNGRPPSGNRISVLKGKVQTEPGPAATAGMAPSQNGPVVFSNGGSDACLPVILNRTKSRTGSCVSGCGRASGLPDLVATRLKLSAQAQAPKSRAPLPAERQEPEVYHTRSTTVRIRHCFTFVDFGQGNCRQRWARCTECHQPGRYQMPWHSEKPTR